MVVSQPSPEFFFLRFHLETKHNQLLRFVLQMDICKVEGAIEYLVKMLNYQAPSGTLVIVESVGGILRNISSIIALRDDYR